MVMSIVFFDILPHREEKFVFWWNKEYLPRIRKSQGFLEARLFGKTRGRPPKFMFICSWETERNRQEWANSPEHQRLVLQAKELMENLRVYDYVEIEEVVKEIIRKV